MSNGNRNSAAAFTALEEEFFREGLRNEREGESRETFADLDEGYRPPSMWRRLFARKATQP
jgi:hypothetical protein